MRTTFDIEFEWKKMSSEELRLANMWYEEDGKSCYAIARLLHRKTATIVNHVRVKKRIEKQGRPFALSLKQALAAETMLKKMVAHARGSLGSRIKSAMSWLFRAGCER